MRAYILLLGAHCQTKTEVAARERRRSVAPVGGATVRGVLVPAAAAIHAVIARRRAGGISLRLTGIIGLPVRAPLPHVATHVVNPKLVGFFRFDHMTFATAVVSVPCHFVYIVGAAIDVALTLLTTLCGILPLSFRRQTEVLARKLVQFSNKRLAVVPAHILYRIVIERMLTWI